MKNEKEYYIEGKKFLNQQTTNSILPEFEFSLFALINLHHPK